MLKKEKEEAIKLRKKGLSIKEIAKKIGVAKSSVSLWVRNVELNLEQISNLSKRVSRIEVIEKRRKARLENEKAKRQIILDKAEKQIEKI